MARLADFTQTVLAFLKEIENRCADQATEFCILSFCEMG